MGFDNIPSYISLFAGFVGVIGMIGGAVFFLRYTATKANLDGKDETIETLKSNRDEWRNKAQELDKEVVGIRSENKVLREIATQTPEILELTKTVNHSIDQQGVVADNIAQLTSEIRKLITGERIARNKK